MAKIVDLFDASIKVGVAEDTKFVPDPGYEQFEGPVKTTTEKGYVYDGVVYLPSLDFAILPVGALSIIFIITGGIIYLGYQIWVCIRARKGNWKQKSTVNALILLGSLILTVLPIVPINFAFIAAWRFATLFLYFYLQIRCLIWLWKKVPIWWNWFKNL
jgi:hypothetical protein